MHPPGGFSNAQTRLASRIVFVLAFVSVDEEGGRQTPGRAVLCYSFPMSAIYQSNHDPGPKLHMHARSRTPYAACVLSRFFYEAIQSGRSALRRSSAFTATERKTCFAGVGALMLPDGEGKIF